MATAVREAFEVLGIMDAETDYVEIALETIAELAKRTSGDQKIHTQNVPTTNRHTGAEPYVAWILFHRTADITDSMLDWIAAVRPDLSNMTTGEAYNASHAWHARFAQGAAFRGPLRDPTGPLIASWPDGARIVQLFTPAEFAAEGMSMGHCVGGDQDSRGVVHGDGTYWNDWKEHKLPILSYRGPDGVPQATLQIEVERRPSHRDPEPAHILQANGPEDGPIRDDVALRIAAWMERALFAPGEAEQFLRDANQMVVFSEDQIKWGTRLSTMGLNRAWKFHQNNRPEQARVWIEWLEKVRIFGDHLDVYKTRRDTEDLKSIPSALNPPKTWIEFGPDLRIEIGMYIDGPFHWEIVGEEESTLLDSKNPLYDLDQERGLSLRALYGPGGREKWAPSFGDKPIEPPWSLTP